MSYRTYLCLRVFVVKIVSKETEHKMRYRRFGRTGWEVSEIGYGMWGMAGWSYSCDDE